MRFTKKNQYVSLMHYNCMIQLVKLTVRSCATYYLLKVFKSDFRILKNSEIHPADSLRPVSIKCQKCFWFLPALGRSCWPLSRSPFLFCVVRAASCGGDNADLFPATTAACFPLYLQSLFQSSCVPGGGDRAQLAATRLSRKPVSCVQKKHVLTACATSGGIFTPGAIHFSSNMTQYAWQDLFTQSAKKRKKRKKWKAKTYFGGMKA